MMALLSTLKNEIYSLVQLWFKQFGVDYTTILPEGPLLVIAPHPDDETIGCGATLARLRAEGRKIRVVIVIDGRASTKSFLISPRDLAEIRRDEALKATGKLGLSGEDVFFLGYPDGEVEKYIDEVSKDIAFHITQFSPAIVFAPHPFDEHEDHRAISHLVQGFQDAGDPSFLLFHYPFWSRPLTLPYGILRCLFTPSLYRHCRFLRAGDYYKNKEEALSQYRSQFENITGEKIWHFFSKASRKRFCLPFELFFERQGRKDHCRCGSLVQKRPE